MISNNFQFLQKSFIVLFVFLWQSLLFVSNAAFAQSPRTNKNQQEANPPITINFTDKMYLRGKGENKGKTIEKIKAFSNHRLISGMVLVDEESDKRNHRYFELLWFVQENVFISNVLIKKPFQLTKKNSLTAYWLRKMTKEEIAEYKTDEKDLDNDTKQDNVLADKDKNAVDNGQGGSDAASAVSSSSSVSSRSSGSGSSGSVSSGSSAIDSGNSGSTSSPVVSPISTATLTSTTYQSCKDNVDYDAGTVNIQKKKVMNYSDGSTKYGPCETETSYPINFDTQSCTFKPDYARKVVVEYGKKTYFNNISVIDLTGCIPSTNTFPLLSEKADCVDDYDVLTSKRQIKKKFYYVNNGFKEYVSDCLLTSDTGDFLGIVLEEYASKPRVDLKSALAIEQYKRYVDVDGKKYYLDKNYIDGTQSWPIKYNQNVCGTSYEVDNVANKVYYKKQLGYTKNGSWNSVGDCEIDDQRVFDLVVDQSTCDITIRYSAKNANDILMVLKKRTYFVDDDSKVVVVQGCAETDDVVAIKQADIVRDYNICDDTLDMVNQQAIANYVRSINYNGRRYTLSSCIQSTDRNDSYTFQHSTADCEPKLDIANGNVYETAYSYYNKGGEQVLVGDCAATGNSFPLKKSEVGCSKGLSPNGLNFIINVYYYYNTATGPVSLSGCQQDMTQGYVPIEEKDIIKEYNECSYYLDKSAGSLTITELRQQKLYSQYASYVDLGGKKVRIAPCKPDNRNYIQEPIINYNNCSASVFVDDNAKKIHSEGYVSPQVNIDYIDYDGFPKNLLTCVATKDIFPIKKEVMDCKPQAISDVPPISYLVKVKRYYIDAESNVKYLSGGNCVPDIVNGDLNKVVPQELFCGVDKNNPNDIGSKYSVDLTTNTVHYNTRWSYFVSSNGFKQEILLQPCSKSWTKAIKALKNNVCAYDHNNTTLITNQWVRKVFSYDRVDALAYDKDLDKTFVVLANDSIAEIDSNAPEHTSVYNVEDKNSTGYDYMKNNCLKMEGEYPYTKENKVDKTVEIDLYVYSYYANLKSKETDPFHDDYFVAQYQWPSKVGTLQPGFNFIDGYKTGFIPAPSDVFDKEVAYYSMRPSAFKIYMKTTYKESYVRLGNPVNYEREKVYVDFGSVNIRSDDNDQREEMFDVFKKAAAKLNEDSTEKVQFDFKTLVVGEVVSNHFPVHNSGKMFFYTSVTRSVGGELQTKYFTDALSPQEADFTNRTGDLITNAIKLKSWYAREFYLYHHTQSTDINIYKTGTSCTPGRDQGEEKCRETRTYDGKVTLNSGPTITFPHQVSFVPYLTTMLNEPDRWVHSKASQSYGFSRDTINKAIPNAPDLNFGSTALNTLVFGAKYNSDETISFERLNPYDFDVTKTKDTMSMIHDEAILAFFNNLLQRESNDAASNLSKSFLEQFQLSYAIRQSFHDYNINDSNATIRYDWHELVTGPLKGKDLSLLRKYDTVDCANYDPDKKIDQKINDLCR